MGFPSKCPICGEANPTGLSYCAVCGNRFTKGQQIAQVGKPSRRKLGKEAKLKLKREKKRGELTDLFKRKKITMEQYRNGLKKLGYTTDIDKAEEFKKFIKSQIKDLQTMKVPPPGGPTEKHDPYASKAELIRDGSGDVMIDFMVKPTPVDRKKMGAIMDSPTDGGPATGPLFAGSLFAREPGPGMPEPGGHATRPVTEKPRIGDIVKVPRVGKAKTPPSTPRKSSRRGLKMVWDEDEDESGDSSRLRKGVYSGEDESGDSSRLRKGAHKDKDEDEFDEEFEIEEDDFEIDMDEYTDEKDKKDVKIWWDDEEDDWWDEEGEGESGWWDDDEWEFEWDEEDEEEFESWGMDPDDDDESGDSSDPQGSDLEDDYDESEDSSDPQGSDLEDDPGSEEEFELDDDWDDPDDESDEDEDDFEDEWD